MNIILVSAGMAKPKVYTAPQVLLFLAVLVLLVVALTSWLLFPVSHGNAKSGKSLLPVALHLPMFNTQAHIDALATQLGELQARMIRLDALSERLSHMAGIRTKELEAERLKPQRGGPEISPYKMSEQVLQQRISDLLDEVELRSDRLSMVEALLLQQSMHKNALPTHYPVQGAYNSSSYGWRVDPFTGHMAFHEGLDFTVETGAPIYAAAGGVVMSAETTPDYGKIVKIDHGSGLETRYAHASRLLVRAGERVEKGQLIAEVGSTGRSTGAHLHFEVRLSGAPLDPRKYLIKDTLSSKL